MKKILKVLLEFFKSLKSETCSNTRLYPKRSQLDNFFLQSISSNKIFKKTVISDKSVVLGSCFSVRIANFFASRFNQKSKEENIHGYMANWGRLYTLKNIEQIIEYTIRPDQNIFIEKNDDYFFDPLREDHVTIENSEEDLKKNIILHREKSKLVLSEADTIILVIGLNEAWYDNKLKIFWGVKPDNKTLQENITRFEIKKFDYEENLVSIKNIIEKLSHINRNLNICFVLGPVPQEAVYASKNIIESFFLDKSAILLAINKIIKKGYSNITYLPFYEYFYVNNPLIFKSDNRHINDFFSEKSMNIFFKNKT